MKENRLMDFDSSVDQSTHSTIRRLSRLALVSLFSISFTAAPLTAQDEETEETFDLSPFLVETSDEAGWNATTTLAGSRLRTNLGDVASQIEVMTMEFMDDFGFTSMEEAAIYSMNAENTQEWTRPGPERQSYSGDLRIRGISNGRRSRDFFEISTYQDNYNLTRVTLASGPNPMMFGIGSPTGQIDYSLARALMNQNKSEIKLSVDSWGSLRGEFHTNQTLIDDKLAVKLAILGENKGFDVEPSIQKNRRFYGTFLYTPFKKTRISAHYEKVSTEGRRPSNNVPYDKVTTWLKAGDLGTAYSNGELFNNDAEWVAADQPIEDDRVFQTDQNAVVIPVGYNPAGIKPFGNFASVYTTSIKDAPWDVIDPVNSEVNGVTFNSDEIYPRDINTMYNLEYDERDADIYNIFINQEILPKLNLEIAAQREEFDRGKGTLMFYRDTMTIKGDPNKYMANGSGELNPYAGEFYLEGPADIDGGKFERDEWRVALAYEFDMRDVTENKWFGLLGRHRLAGLISGLKSEDYSQEYRYNIMPKVENGLMYDSYFEGYDYGEPDELGRLSYAGLGEDFTASPRQLRFRSYVGLDGRLVPESEIRAGDVIEVTDSNGEVWTIDPYHLADGTNGERLSVGRNTEGLKSVFDTKQLSYQGFLLNDRIVITYGWREDSANTAEEEDPGAMWQNPETGEVVSASSVGFQAHMDHWGYEDLDPAREQSGETELKGIVVHPFRNWSWQLPLGADISFLYTESNTFAPTTQWLYPDGNQITGEMGEGTDKGIRLGLFNGKFNLRYNEYEVNSGPSRVYEPFSKLRFQPRGVLVAVLQALVKDKAHWREKFPVWPLEDHPDAIPDKIYPFASGSGFDEMNFFNYADPYQTTASTLATGREISLSWKPRPNLDIRLTYSSQEVVQDQMMPLWLEYWEEFADIMDNTTFTEGYIPGSPSTTYHDPAGYDMDGNGLIEQFGWDDIRGTYSSGRWNVWRPHSQPWGQNDDNVSGGWTQPTIKEIYMERVMNGFIGLPVVRAYNGRRNDFVRDNRLNLNVMYRFTEGRLKGFRTGIGYRWREAPGIGVGVQEVNGQKVPDTDIVLFGEDETNIDLSFGYAGRFKWLGDRWCRIGLNIRNAFPQNDYMAKQVDYFTGETINQVRVNGRLFVLDFSVEL